MPNTVLFVMKNTFELYKERYVFDFRKTDLFFTILGGARR